MTGVVGVGFIQNSVGQEFEGILIGEIEDGEEPKAGRKAAEHPILEDIHRRTPESPGRGLSR
jgi:hypothetical protein